MYRQVSNQMRHSEFVLTYIFISLKVKYSLIIMAGHISNPHSGNQTRTNVSIRKLDEALLLSEKQKFKLVSYIHSIIHMC